MKFSKEESGQSLVEMALTAPLLVLMFLGMVELGQICYAGINVSNAAKSAGQYAAQNTLTAVDTDTMVQEANNEVSTVPGIVQTSDDQALEMPRSLTMPDGSALPTGNNVVRRKQGTKYPGSWSLSYCSCSSPNTNQTPFDCLASDALLQCTGNSHLEQNIIIETHIAVNPVIPVPGLSGPMNLYGHAVVKRLQ